jgi:hypothetical protein
LRSLGRIGRIADVDRGCRPLTFIPFLFKEKELVVEIGVGKAGINAKMPGTAVFSGGIGCGQHIHITTITTVGTAGETCDNPRTGLYVSIPPSALFPAC